MSGSTRYSPELRERAVRMVIKNRPDYPSEWVATADSILEKVRRGRVALEAIAN